MQRSNAVVGLSTLIVGVMTLCMASNAWAGDDKSNDQSALQSGKSVRHKVLYRSTRFEAAPILGLTTGDAYLRNAVVGAKFTYHLTNEVGLGVAAGYSPLHLETDLAKNTKTVLQSNDPGQLEDLEFSYLQWFAGFEVDWVPLFGKFSLMNSTTVAWDIHLIGGLSLMKRAGCVANDPDTPCNGTSADPTTFANVGISPAPTIGGGFRMFLGDAYAISFQVRDHLYQRAEAGSGSRQGEFSSNVLATLGVSFFFPQTVKISR